MYLVAIAWMYVVLMMSIVEALSPQGTVLGALFTFVLYGLLPLGIVIYILGAPMRRRARTAAASGPAPDAGGHAAGQPVSPERKEP
jgi:predicted membrane channel-forming protein YqfA (hemolysin III family)